MNKRKPVDYTELYTLLDGAIDGSDTQMAQYTAIGKAVAMRPEKGAAVAAAEYLQQNRPELTGFSPRNLRRMRAFYQTYGDHPDLLELAMRIGWTLNILILEADLDLAERVWYLNAVLRFGWTKTVLKEKLMETAHLENSILDESDSLWYTKEEQVQDHMSQEGSDRGMKENCYICCDLKSFYASVEYIERGLDPMTTNLVMASKRRTEKTICLAVTPSLKAYGISERARLFEVMQRVGGVNAQRKWKALGKELTGSSWRDIARCFFGKTDEFYNEKLFCRLFGVNAELLIDRTWDCSIADVKTHKPRKRALFPGGCSRTLIPLSKPGWWCRRWQSFWLRI